MSMSFLVLLLPVHSPDWLISTLSVCQSRPSCAQNTVLIVWYWDYHSDINTEYMSFPSLLLLNTVLIVWYWDYHSDINTECMSFPALLPPKHSPDSLILGLSFWYQHWVFGLSFWYQHWVYVLPCPPSPKHSPDSLILGLAFWYQHWVLGLSFWYQHWVYVLPCPPAPAPQTQSW